MLRLFRDKWRHQMAFRPRSGTLAGYASSLSRRETDNLHASENDMLGSQRREEALYPFLSQQSFCPYSPSITEASYLSLEIIGNNGPSHPRDPEKMNPLTLNLGFLLLDASVSTSSSQADGVSDLPKLPNRVNGRAWIQSLRGRGLACMRFSINCTYCHL